MKRKLILPVVVAAVLLIAAGFIAYRLCMHRDFKRLSDYDSGPALVTKDQKFGFADKKGKIIVPIEYDIANSFIDGMARVVKDDKVGYVDSTGRLFIPLMYESLYFSNDFGLGLASYEGKWGWINERNQVVIPFIYEDVYWDFDSQGLVSVSLDGENYTYIDTCGRTVLPDTYEELSWGFSPYARVRKNNRYGLIGKDGEVVMPILFQEIRSNCDNGESYPCKIEDRWGIYTLGKGIEMTPFDEIGFFSEGLAPASRDQQWGYIDMLGNIKIPLQFDYAGNFANATAKVTTKNREHQIDTAGNILPKQYPDYFFGFRIK